LLSYPAPLSRRQRIVSYNQVTTVLCLSYRVEL
jgi:hypothetical protein